MDAPHQTEVLDRFKAVCRTALFGLEARRTRRCVSGHQADALRRLYRVFHACSIQAIVEERWELISREPAPTDRAVAPSVMDEQLWADWTTAYLRHHGEPHGLSPAQPTSGNWVPVLRLLNRTAETIPTEDVSITLAQVTFLIEDLLVTLEHEPAGDPVLTRLSSPGAAA